MPDGDRNPENLWRLIPNDQRAVETRVTGDFLICPIEPRKAAWQRLASDLDRSKLSEITKEILLDEVPEWGAKILAGQVRGRIVVKIV